ncbi:type IV toxin-antitoxin system AbiEi family antitoxin domain-containing protein [Lentzea tibetensis]|uniref:Type IV toxin-antitoxin system AbiEi family antitoxin domain-containing protein n=1 Tax=Lentzea tibetensis TaxID=2591470 RepID=A0A563EPH0_9PSEU|nr:type IV toxin-antitoxin system AbiEi family antitoxin domain-containing protein [Lentzea tibetensis]TWP49293.1 type IV toxin-antitoxin system AbiEi family antitoxin domain-containing protein [Lentzea tibetensis]
MALDQLRDTFTTAAALGSGMHRRDLYGLRDEGALVELSRGVFRKADAPTPTWPDLLAVSLRAPAAVVCCVSAAVVHDLTDEIPREVQIAVSREQRPPRIEHPPTEVFRFSPATFESGLTHVEAAPGEEVRVYSPERTVVDLMRLRSRLGEPLALSALRRYLRGRSARPGEVLALARTLGVLGPVRTAVDAVIAE